MEKSKKKILGVSGDEGERCEREEEQEDILLPDQPLQFYVVLGYCYYHGDIRLAFGL